MNIDQFVRPNILEMKPYSSARDEYNSMDDVSLLDANENPFETDLNRYPDPYQKDLKNLIGKVKSIAPENIFLGNGSDEAIDLILRIFCEPLEDSIIIPDPTYGMYQVSAAIQNVEVKKVALNKIFELDVQSILELNRTSGKVLFLCNPNNPSGNFFSRNDVISLLNQFNGIVVIDEAYIDFTKEESFIVEIENYPNLIVLQTFSKAWGMAGLRLGMAFTNNSIIKLFNKVKAPYNLSSLTQKTALAEIEKGVDQLFNTVNNLISERKRLEKSFNEMNCVVNMFPSETNFLLVKFRDYKKAYNALEKNGLIVRDRSKALHCEGCLRLTVGTRKENDQVIETLKAL